MKKRFIISWFLFLFILFGIGWMSETVDDEIDSYYFIFNQQEIVVGSDFHPEIFGEENSILNEEDGILYQYDSLEIVLVDEKIHSIRFLDHTISTKENIKITDSYQNMIDTYGNEFLKEENQYIYQKGTTKLIFTIQNQCIASIEYCIFP